MSIALARKYRPKRFADVAVQQHVSATLQGAIARGRVAHGYLLCGPRGVGKTTLARVLAMALNCERRVSAPGEGASNEALPREAGEPCGECDSCRRIWNGSASLDVVEIDAASNRGVDDARELRERAMYAPSGDDRYKVYIVDEAHMLTREAWNALLKILEEPPPRVVFVFATTEPQKIAQAAAPVLSRLQRFDFKRMGVGDIKLRLSDVLTKENVQAEPDALALIARAADGSMRDALSLTDQVLSMGDGTLSAERVREALGLVAEDELVALLDIVAERRAADVFPFIGRLADAGVDFTTFLAGFGDIVRTQLAVVLGAEVPDLSDWTREALTERRGRQSAGDLVQILSALTELEPRFRKSGQQQLLIEASLVRLALLDRAVDVEELLKAMGGEAGGGNQGRAAARVEPAAKASPVAPEARQEGWQQSRPEPRQGSRPEPREDSRPEARPEPRQERQPVRPRPVASASAAPAAAAMPAPAAAPAPVTASAAPGPLTALDVNRVAGVWDSLVEQLRAAGKTLVATALAHASPSAVTAKGDLTIALDEPNEFYGKAIENAAGDVAAVLRTWFTSVERIVVLGHGREAQAPTKRLTSEMLRAERVDALRKQDPVLGAAIDALELEIVD